MSLVNLIIEDARKKYIRDYGQVKYNKIEAKIKNSSTFADVCNQSITNRHALLGGDFKTVSFAAMPFCVSRSQDVMGQLIALEIWNETCNINNKFLSEDDLVRVADSCLGTYRRG